MTVPPGAVGTVVADVVLPVLATIAVVLRLCAHKKMKSPLRSDDWTIIVALTLSLAISISGIYSSAAGLHGVPYNEMSPKSFENVRRLEFSDVIICHVIYGLTKISIVLFYKKIFTTNRFLFVANVVLIIISIFMVLSFFMVLFAARGVSSWWDTPVALEGTQYNLSPPQLITGFAVVDIALDLTIIIMPLPAIRKLHMSIQKKIYVSGIFLLGAFCLVCSIIRFYWLLFGFVRALEQFTGDDIKKKTEQSDDNDLWSHIEANASVLTACLPTLGPLIGGNYLVSLIGSIRSFFTIPSKSTFSLAGRLSRQKEQDSADSGSRKRAWYELHPQGVNETGAAGVAKVHDPEAQSQASDTIMVHKTFAAAEHNPTTSLE